MSSHPLIPRQQTYMLNRKLVTIHSEDRDIKNHPDSNHFEIKLPHIMENVQSMRLVECSFPSTYYTFSNEYQNTKMSFRLFPMITQIHREWIDTWDNAYPLTIEIQPGLYDPNELATEIQEKMNARISIKLNELIDTIVYKEMKVIYDKVSQRFVFGNSLDKFILLFDQEEHYQNYCKQPKMWNLQLKWGLGYYLGFQRLSYESIPKEKEFIFSYKGENGKWLYNNGYVHYLIAPCAPDIMGEKVMYMEIEKYNSYDELTICPENTNGIYNNKYSSKVNSAFAKIPIVSSPNGEIVDSRNGFLQNVTHFDVPEEKISRLQFLFRYHDGRFVDFGCLPFNFTIEFNCLKNEINRSYTVRVPTLYQL